MLTSDAAVQAELLELARLFEEKAGGGHQDVDKAAGV